MLYFAISVPESGLLLIQEDNNFILFLPPVAWKLRTIRVERNREKMKKLFFIIMFAFVGALFSASENSDASPCQNCHETSLAGSTHKEMECGNCHRGEESFFSGDETKWPHPVMAENVKCKTCHEEQATKHGGIKNGFPSCKDCHGTHGVLKPSQKNSSTHRARIPGTCGRCHENGKYAESVHGKALTKKGLIISAVCTDCHGNHLVRAPKKNDIPVICGKCHEGILIAYEDSIHGKAYHEGVMESPVCTDCHGEHTIAAVASKESAVNPANVPKTCARCHENHKLIKKFNLPTQRLSTYKESFHGIASKFGEGHAATCASCHGEHDVLPSSDLKSRTHKKNLPKTCGKCHPGAGRFFAEGTVHLQPSPEHDPLVFYIRFFYKLMISGMIGGFALLIAVDLYGWRKRKKREEAHEDEQE